MPRKPFDDFRSPRNRRRLRLCPKVSATKGALPHVRRAAQEKEARRQRLKLRVKAYKERRLVKYRQDDPNTHYKDPEADGWYGYWYWRRRRRTTRRKAHECPHRLFKFLTQSNFVCDGCQGKFPPSTVMYGCRVCNYDLCVDCFYNQDVVDWSAAGDEEFEAIPGYDKLYKQRKRGRFMPKREKNQRCQSKKKKKDRSAERKRKREQKQRAKARRQDRLHKYRYHNDFAECHDSFINTGKVSSEQRDINPRVTKVSQKGESQKNTSAVALTHGRSQCIKNLPATGVKPKEPSKQVFDAVFHRIHTQQWIQFKYERNYCITRTDIFALLESFDFLDLPPWISATIGEFAEDSTPFYDPPVETFPFWSDHKVFTVFKSGKCICETVTFSMPAIFRKRQFDLSSTFTDFARW